MQKPKNLFQNKQKKAEILKQRYEKLKQIANQKNLKYSSLLVHPIASRKVLKQQNIIRDFDQFSNPKHSKKDKIPPQKLQISQIQTKDTSLNLSKISGFNPNNPEEDFSICSQSQNQSQNHLQIIPLNHSKLDNSYRSSIFSNQSGTQRLQTSLRALELENYGGGDKSPIVTTHKTTENSLLKPVEQHRKLSLPCQNKYHLPFLQSHKVNSLKYLDSIRNSQNNNSNNHISINIQKDIPPLTSHNSSIFMPQETEDGKKKQEDHIEIIINSDLSPSNEEELKEKFCRICKDDECFSEELICPCNCDSENYKYVHSFCLQKWVLFKLIKKNNDTDYKDEESGLFGQNMDKEDFICEICQSYYNVDIDQKQKYSKKQLRKLNNCRDDYLLSNIKLQLIFFLTAIFISIMLSASLIYQISSQDQDIQNNKTKLLFELTMFTISFFSIFPLKNKLKAIFIQKSWKFSKKEPTEELENQTNTKKNLQKIEQIIQKKSQYKGDKNQFIKYFHDCSYLQTQDHLPKKNKKKTKKQKENKLN